MSFNNISIVFNNVRVLQVVYDANHLSKLVEKKEKCVNKIEYLHKQQTTSLNSKRSTTRVSSDRDVLFCLSWLLSRYH